MTGIVMSASLLVSHWHDPVARLLNSAFDILIVAIAATAKAFTISH